MQRIKVSFDTWIQLLGMLGVIGGLVFVGLEMRQTQQIAIAGQIQERFNSQALMFLSPLQGDENMLKIMTTTNTDEAYLNLTEEEQLAYLQLNRWRIASSVNIYTQYELGMLPEGSFAQVFPSIVGLYDNCRLRPIINLLGTPAYKEFLATLENRC